MNYGIKVGGYLSEFLNKSLKRNWFVVCYEEIGWDIFCVCFDWFFLCFD